MQKKEKPNKKEGVNMPMIVEKTIHTQQTDSNRFMGIQEKRLRKLEQMNMNKNDGKRVNKGMIVKELQQAGILDKKGNLSAHYTE